MLRKTAAFGVHVFTATGAAFALLAMFAAVERRWTVMFAWLAVALVVDAIDGTFARLLHVKVLAPRWSGDVLDLVVDILTYVFVPAYALVAAGLLPAPVAMPLAIAIMMTSVLYFADQHMKRPDNHFVGFPAVWNLVVFFLFLLRPPPWVSAFVVLALCVVTFIPVPFVHPFRVRRWRNVNLTLLAVGFALAIVALLYGLEPGPWITAALCGIGCYFVAVGLIGPRPIEMRGAP